MTASAEALARSRAGKARNRAERGAAEEAAHLALAAFQKALYTARGAVDSFTQRARAKQHLCWTGQIDRLREAVGLPSEFDEELEAMLTNLRTVTACIDALAWAVQRLTYCQLGFERANVKGKVGEWLRYHHMQAQGYEALEQPAFGYTPTHDLTFTRDSHAHTEEVKTDFKTTYTKNLFIEVSEHGQPGKPGARPSGIYKTAAALYVLFSPAEQRFYVAEAQALRDWLEADTKPDLRPNQNEGGKTWGRLVPVSRWHEVPTARTEQMYLQGVSLQGIFTH